MGEAAGRVLEQDTAGVPTLCKGLVDMIKQMDRLERCVPLYCSTQSRSRSGLDQGPQTHEHLCHRFLAGRMLWGYTASTG